MDIKIKQSTYDRFGVNPRLFASPVELKRELLKRMLEQESKAADSVKRIYAPRILPTVPTMQEDELNELLAERVSEIDSKAFDPPSRERRRDLPIRRVGQLERTMRDNARFKCSVEKAATLVFHQWTDHYSKPLSLSNMYRQRDKPVMKRLQAARNDGRTRSQMVQNTVAAFSCDRQAMSIWSDLLGYSAHLERAKGEGDEEKISRYGVLLDEFFNRHCTDAFLGRIILILANNPVNEIWERTDVLFDKLEDDGQRQVLVKGTTAEGWEPRALVESVLDLFADCKLFPPKRK